MALTPGFEPGPRWWEASALTTAPSLAPSFECNCKPKFIFLMINNYISLVEKTNPIKSLLSSNCQLLPQRFISPVPNGRSISSKIRRVLFQTKCAVYTESWRLLFPRINGPIVGQWMLHVMSVCTPCCMLLPTRVVRTGVLAQSLKPVKFLSQQLATRAFLLFRDRCSVAQQCQIRQYSFSNILEASHAYQTQFTRSHGLYLSHNALTVPALLGIVASVCAPLPTRTQQLPTLLAQQCWRLSHPFARSFTNGFLLRWLTMTETLFCFFYRRIRGNIYAERSTRKT